MKENSSGFSGPQGLGPLANFFQAKLFEYFEDARAIYVVTELCTGGNIGELDAQVKKFRESFLGGFWGPFLGGKNVGI